MQKRPIHHDVFFFQNLFSEIEIYMLLRVISILLLFQGRTYTHTLRRIPEIFNGYKRDQSGFGGLEVTCWPLVSKFAGSKPAEAVGFFRAKKKSSARLPSEGK